VRRGPQYKIMHQGSRRGFLRRRLADRASAMMPADRREPPLDRADTAFARFPIMVSARTGACSGWCRQSASLAAHRCRGRAVSAWFGPASPPTRRSVKCSTAATRRAEVQ